MTDGHQLRLFNSLGRRLQDFIPLQPRTVRMYSCGPTVYAFPHLGNMRPYVFADTLRRVLVWKGYEVHQVVNITDVGHVLQDADQGEDKVEHAAQIERRSVREIADFYTRAFMADIEALNITSANVYPKASEYVPSMVEFAQVLEKRGVTYQLPQGLYFDTAQSPRYGELALMDVAGQRAGARVAEVGGRRNKTDFAVWRAEQPGAPRAMRWPSPWGWGAPGWHLECSVMSILLLGDHFDIHTGGVDHRELHHVNEIAQSEAYLSDGKPWVPYWLHNEFVLFGQQRMAKSAGTTTRVATLAEEGFHPLAYRLLLLNAHYRNQVEYTADAMRASQSSLRRLMARTEQLRPLPAAETLADAYALLSDGAGRQEAAELLAALDEAASNDLNTPQILAVLWTAIRSGTLHAEEQRVVVAACDRLLGLRLGELRATDVRASDRALDPEELALIERLVEARSAARARRDWPEADRIRAQLEELGVAIADSQEGTRWTLE